MFSSLLAVVSTIQELSAELLEVMPSYLIKETKPKKSLLLKPGEICNHLYFIEKGFVRAFYIKDEQEITSWFMHENDMIISIYSFFKQKPSYESIELLEDTTLIYISYQDLQKLYHDFPEFNYVGRVLTEYYYGLSEERLMTMRMQTSLERYDSLLKTNPQIFHRAPLKYIASYLGMKPETISRIRRQPTKAATAKKNSIGITQNKD